MTPKSARDDPGRSREFAFSVARDLEAVLSLP